jgi:hypothetical protein
MKTLTITEKVKMVLEPKLRGIKARLFVTREDGITIYDSVQNNTTNSVAALVSGVWQASEALMNLVHNQNHVMEFRLGFDTSSQGIYLFPFTLNNKRYFLGAIYADCLNPGLLKRQMAVIKDEMEVFFKAEPVEKKAILTSRQGYLFKDITDAEMDRLFSLGGV